MTSSACDCHELWQCKLWQWLWQYKLFVKHKNIPICLKNYIRFISPLPFMTKWRICRIKNVRTYCIFHFLCHIWYIVLRLGKTYKKTSIGPLIRLQKRAFIIIMFFKKCWLSWFYKPIVFWVLHLQTLRYCAFKRSKWSFGMIMHLWNLQSATQWKIQMRFSFGS